MGMADSCKQAVWPCSNLQALTLAVDMGGSQQHQALMSCLDHVLEAQ